MTPTFKLLKELLSRLTKKEIKLLKKKITYNPIQAEFKNNKSKKLVELILNKPDLSEVQALKYIYSSANRIALIKLVERTILKIDEIYISFDYDPRLFSSERNFQYFILKRKLLILQMRLLRGVESDLPVHLEKIAVSSKKYELYDILIEVLLMKQRFTVIQKGKKAVNEIEFEIVKYENLHRKVQRARNMWTILSAKIDQSDSFREYASELDEVRDLLRTDFEETNSATICYFYLLIETEANQNERNYLVADLNLKKMHNLIMENSSLYTKARRGEVLVNIANNEIFLNNYSSAIKNAENAKLYFEKGTGNADVASEIEFFARFYNNELDLAEKIIEEIYISARKRNSPFAYGKRAYLYACIMTIKGEIEKSNELLGEVREIEKNKGGWNIAMRVLTIINCIEAKDYESADLKVMNMEKFIKRNSKLHHIRKRDVLILRILLKLINEGFDFKKVYKARKHYFELLEGKQPDYYWKIRSPELIIFHEWFKKKIKP